MYFSSQRNVEEICSQPLYIVFKNAQRGWLGRSELASIIMGLGLIPLLTSSKSQALTPHIILARKGVLDSRSGNGRLCDLGAGWMISPNVCIHHGGGSHVEFSYGRNALVFQNAVSAGDECALTAKL